MYLENDRSYSDSQAKKTYELSVLNKTISLLSVEFKICEKMILKRVKPIIEVNNLFPTHQRLRCCYIFIINIHIYIPHQPNSKIATFADDTIILAVRKNHLEIQTKFQETCNKINQWMEY